MRLPNTDRFTHRVLHCKQPWPSIGPSWKMFFDLRLQVDSTRNCHHRPLQLRHHTSRMNHLQMQARHSLAAKLLQKNSNSNLRAHCLLKCLLRRLMPCTTTAGHVPSLRLRMQARCPLSFEALQWRHPRIKTRPCGSSPGSLTEACPRHN